MYPDAYTAAVCVPKLPPKARAVIIFPPDAQVPAPKIVLVTLKAFAVEL